MPKTSKNRISMDGDYSTVELDEHLDTNCSYPENSELGQTKGKQKPTIKPKPMLYYSLKMSHSLNHVARIYFELLFICFIRTEFTFPCLVHNSVGLNCSYPENSELGQTKGKQKPTIKPKPKSSC
jgi:hypothetical protein